MDDPVAIALEGIAHFAVGLGEPPAPRLGRMTGIAGAGTVSGRNRHVGQPFHRRVSGSIYVMTDKHKHANGIAMTANVTLSASAAKQINTILASQSDGTLLRIGVEGGGCSGFSYTFNLDTSVNSDDQLIERDGAKVVIDEASLPFLDGSEIDYVDELIGASFKIHNPNATAACGCGTSFSI